MFLNTLEAICYPFLSCICHLGQVNLSRLEWDLVEWNTYLFVP